MNSGATPEVTAADETRLLAEVRRAWAEVLDIPDPARVPLDTSFLEAGGSSLLLIMLWEELHGLTDQMLRVSDLFVHSTVRRQADLLAGAPGPDRPAVGGVRVAGGDRRERLLGRAGRD